VSQSLPQVGSDDNTWGTMLNGYLGVAHNQYGGAYSINSINSATTSSYNIGTTESSNPVANEYFLVNCSSTNVTITLPSATNTSFSYMVYNVKKTDTSANTVTLATTSSQTIDGSSTYVISTPYMAIQIVCDGSNWWVI